MPRDPPAAKLCCATAASPQTVGIVHCVGSRDENTNRYCSRVCCMYSLKLAHLIKEKTDAEVYNFYIDMRTPGKGFEEFYNRVAEEGVHFIRGRVADVYPDPESDGRLLVSRRRHADGLRAQDSCGHGRAFHRPGAATRRAGRAPPVSTSVAPAKASSWSAIPSWRRSARSPMASSWRDAARAPRTFPTRWRRQVPPQPRLWH